MGALFGRSRKEADPARAYPLEELVEDLHDLRMTLAVDLTAAAGAAEAGENAIARDIIDADRQELARFVRVANLKLAGLPAPRREPSPWRRRVATALPVVPVVSAMALSAAAAAGALHLPGTGTDHHAAHAAVVQPAATASMTTYNQLVKVLDSDPSASQVIAAASRLHKQLSHMLATSTDNPSQAAEVAQLLHMEQSLLLREQPPGASVVLNATRKLAARLVTFVPHAKPSMAPTFVPTPQPSSNHDRHPVATAAPAPSQSPSPKATPSSTPSSTAKNNPSASPSPSNTSLPRFPR